MTEQYEIFRDPFRMLILLATLVSEQKGENELRFDHVPYFENETFLIQHEKFVYKKVPTEITWFQFLGRDIACNQDYSREEYNKMFVDCLASLYQIK
ncbi:hypothetical protein GCM10008018_00880 [Paenibacillus marchantiophytorum]|uniref:Uncharacterized protein n=1 Tax=Paenibacillus marchantiophytorum TaxID=1619310 RepID=A0ABQ2BMG6_9BACL|nr:hypothetical protein [Paenibacillus marchantiophytorum]GGI43202.1 hypothetical protein GCM10008018_00880 [Paenibacillus marchantiophytorum]